MKTGGMTLFWHLRANFEPDEIYPYRELDMKHDGDRLDVRHHLSIPNLLALPPERQRRVRVYTGHWPYVACELLGWRLRDHDRAARSSRADHLASSAVPTQCALDAG